jgi:leukotriene-A4 hydrolase
VTHTDLIWELDFENRVIRGNVEHSMRLLFDIKNVHFDTENIDVDAAWINDDSSLFNVNDSGKPHHLGRRLSIAIPKEFQFIGSEFKVKFKYSICDKSIATQWLDAASTKGGLYPYLFTQSFAIHSRSLFPCMDTPSVKATFTAKVSCPKWCTVLMSGLLLSTDPSPTDESSHIFTWHQAVPVPAYLVALAAGNLVSRDISERVRIWAEPEVVEAAFFEFAETEAFLCAAEDITGLAYQWGRYDVLCLPPSFPYGGTENPCLTFVTPTLLAGDRSLADVIAHEVCS